LTSQENVLTRILVIFFFWEKRFLFFSLEEIPQYENASKFKALLFKPFSPSTGQDVLRAHKAYTLPHIVIDN